MAHTPDQDRPHEKDDRSFDGKNSSHAGRPLFEECSVSPDCSGVIHSLSREIVSVVLAAMVSSLSGSEVRSERCVSSPPPWSGSGCIRSPSRSPRMEDVPWSWSVSCWTYRQCRREWKSQELFQPSSMSVRCRRAVSRVASEIGDLFCSPVPPVLIGRIGLSSIGRKSVCGLVVYRLVVRSYYHRVRPYLWGCGRTRWTDWCLRS